MWLYKATDNNNFNYFNYFIQNGESFGGTTWAISEFSWDVKYAGLQVLAAMVIYVLSHCIILYLWRRHLLIYVCV